MSLKIITPPTELITVEEAAAFMRAEFSDDEESLIETMITASRQWCEEYLRRAIGVQTVEDSLYGFPSSGRGVILLRPPVIELTSVIYTDSSGGVITLVEDDDYIISYDAYPSEIISTGAWPLARDSAGSVRVRYQTGYYGGGSPAISEELPATIRTAILMQVADLYNNRESQVERPLTANPTVERLISPYRLEMGI